MKRNEKIRMRGKTRFGGFKTSVTGEVNRTDSVLLTGACVFNFCLFVFCLKGLKSQKSLFVSKVAVSE